MQTPIDNFITPGKGDAPMRIRQATILNVAIYDALAPYHPTAVGMYSQLPRQTVAKEDELRTCNIAIVTSSYRALLWMFPGFKDYLDEMVRTTSNCTVACDAAAAAAAGASGRNPAERQRLWL